MDPRAALVASLKEFCTAAEIRGLWRQAMDAMVSKSTLNLHINSHASAGGSGSAIPLNTTAEQANFISACRQALDELEDTTTTRADQLGTGVDFSQRPVMV